MKYHYDRKPQFKFFSQKGKDMEFLQARWKAVAATLATLVSNLVAFYQANQNVTLKGVVMSVVAALVSGAVVHQVVNKGE